MARHGKTGQAYEDYLARRRRTAPRAISGRYTTDGGQVFTLTLNQIKRKQKLRGDGKGKKVTHYYRAKRLGHYGKPSRAVRTAARAKSS